MGKYVALCAGDIGATAGWGLVGGGRGERFGVGKQGALG